MQTDDDVKQSQSQVEHVEMTADQPGDDEEMVNNRELTDPLLAGADTNNKTSEAKVLPEALTANPELGE